MTTAVRTAVAPSIAAPSRSTRLDPREVDASLSAALDALFSKQHADGHWCAELEGDSILSSEYLLMKAILGQRAAGSADSPEWADVGADSAVRYGKMLGYLRALQRQDGTWGQYPGSPADVSACVKAYFALKLFGDDARAPHMLRAKEAILALGGAEKINTFSMFYLACLGQASWDACPSIPPEIVWLPRWFPFHMDKVSAWTRTMILPLALCTALRPVRRVPEELGCAELFVDPSARGRLNKPWDNREPVSWTNVFLMVDRALKIAQKAGLTPLRGRAVSDARDWIVDRMRAETTDGLGAIFPPMVYIQVALQAMGYARSHPVRAEAERQLDRLIVEAPDHVRIQPCFSPVWDTGIALYAVTEAGLTKDSDERVARACEWLCAREVRIVGDWIRNLRPEDRAGFARAHKGRRPWAAWAFEYLNEWYPDVDDTVMVAKAMRRASAALGPVDDAFDASERATRWVMAMQNDDGGWAAFDRTRDRPWMEKVPFADHNAMQDPSCADITGRTLESLVTCGVERTHPAVLRGVEYLRAAQRPEGCWWGRWGSNYVYGTWQAVGGLGHAGVPKDDPMMRRALAWLKRAQRPDGGFGETCDSYIDPTLMGRGPSSASQTAWGAMALMFLTTAHDPAVARAVRWLMDHQLDADAPSEPWPARVDAGDGNDGFLGGANGEAPMASHPLDEPAGAWREPWFTGTGFPKVFYLRYHLYRHYFPVMALARWKRLGSTDANRHSA